MKLSKFLRTPILKNICERLVSQKLFLIHSLIELQLKKPNFEYLGSIIWSITIGLKVQLSKLNNNKYMIASTEITNTEIFAFVAALVLVKP